MKIKASYHQERLWFIDRFESGQLYDSSPIYHNIPLILEIEGTLDIGILEQSFQAVINRHEALRTRIITVDNEPVQLIEPKVDFKLKIINWPDEPGTDLYDRAIKASIEEVKQPFLLDKDLLIRASLFQIKKQTSILGIGIHHIISDRFSLQILAREIILHYEAYLDDQSPRLPGLSIHYADFSIFQWEMPKKVQESLFFHWKRQLMGSGFQPLELPTDYPRALVHVFEEGRETFAIPGALSEKLTALGGKTGKSNFVILLAAMKVLLHRYTGQEEIIIGTNADNRTEPGTGHIIGPIANLLPLYTHVSSHSTFTGILARVERTLEKAYKYKDLPFEKLAADLNLQKDMSRTALFDFLFQYEDSAFAISSKKDLKINIFETNLGWGKYDLNLLVRQRRGFLVYNKFYYEAATISRFIQHYMNTLEILVSDPDLPICQFSFLTGEERQQLLVEWNQTRANYPKNKTIIQLFREEVEKAPCNTALVYEHNQLTYSELQRRVNHLYGYLENDGGVQGNDLVGLLFERSRQMIIALLAVLKAGAAYMPIEPSSPGDRIDYILKDSACSLLIIDEQSRHKINKEFNGKIITIETGEPKKNENINNSPANNHRPGNAEDVAYVIYTSGTTGFPKGCLISHRNVVRLLKNDKNYFDFNEKDTWIMAHSYCFDFSVWEMYGALLYGGKLVIPPWDKVRDINVFLSTIKIHQVTVLNQTPSSFYQLIEEEKRQAAKNLGQHLRYVIFGGERLEPANLKEWINWYPLNRILLINMFGITETTVHVTYFKLKEEDIRLFQGRSPIGFALPETTIYIFSPDRMLVPIGVPGELYIGGTGLSRGYLNRVRLTMERFIKNPFKSEEILYKTGDLGRRLPTGNIEFLGRNDEQVQIRGYRIEPGEIEHRLLSYHGIKEARVIPGNDDRKDTYLCAYFVSEKEPDISELRNYLLQKLPNYMIPAYFVKLSKIPLTPNGKIDGKSLPAPHTASLYEEHYQAPGNPVEEKLVEIWAEVLAIKKEKIGIDGNFFDLGGHSLKAASLIARIHQEMDAKVPMAEIFTTPTVRGLAKYIKGSLKNKYTGIEPVEKKEYYVLSPAQKRLFVIQQLFKRSLSYNMPAVFRIEGKLEKYRVEETFKKLVYRHESLRTSFHPTPGEPVQVIHEPPTVVFNVGYKKIEPGEEENAIKEFISPFELSRAPLIRAGLLETNKTDHLLMIDIHHIVSDGISIAILAKEFIALYRGEELPPPRLRYKDYAAWRERLADCDDNRKQEQYWLDRFKGEIPTLNLPTDFEREETQTSRGDKLRFTLDRELSRQLLQLVKETDTTLYTVILAVSNILLSKYTDQDDIIIGTGVAGRIHADLENIVGMFINMLPMWNRPLPSLTFKEFLQKVKKNALEAFENQDYPFNELVKNLGLQGRLDRNPVFDVVVQVQNFDIETLGGKEGLGDITIVPYEFAAAQTHFDLLIEAVETHDTVNISFIYSTALFKRSTMDKMKDWYIKILEQVLSAGDIKLEDITISLELKDIKTMVLQEDVGDFEF